MSLKQIPFVTMPAGSVLQEALPDGRYASISFSKRPVGTYRLSDPFPWKTSVFVFKDGEAREVGSGSSPGDVIVGLGATKVFLVGLDDEQRVELDAKLAKVGVALTPA